MSSLIKQSFMIEWNEQETSDLERKEGNWIYGNSWRMFYNEENNKEYIYINYQVWPFQYAKI